MLYRLTFKQAYLMSHASGVMRGMHCITEHQVNLSDSILVPSALLHSKLALMNYRQQC